MYIESVIKANHDQTNFNFNFIDFETPQMSKV